MKTQEVNEKKNNDVRGLRPDSRSYPKNDDQPKKRKKRNTPLWLELAYLAPTIHNRTGVS